ncbi:MAG: prepilin-type N-terminal cleavage/methylation domain-containing protein [Planctomycetes bacterium]|nr:prepilin-type N-terminal cleavage/methylation domain-containing protein [Planctomycetota bacterium]
MRRCTRRAFTLIELLVVVAIIALLISILLPSMTAARDQGKKIKCASNEKQLGLGLLYYVHEYGYYPADHYQPPSGGEWMISWVPRIRVYSNFQDDIFWCPSTPSEFRWAPSPRDEYNGSLPTVEYGYRHGEKPLTAPFDEPFFSYVHNGSGLVLFTAKCLGLGMHSRESYQGELPGFSEIPERDVVRPADMIAIADSRGDGASDTEISANRWRASTHPGTRHFGGSEVLFADGHVVHMRLDNQLLCKLDVFQMQLGSWVRPQIEAEFDGAIVRRWTNDWKEHRNEWRRR